MELKESGATKEAAKRKAQTIVAPTRVCLITGEALECSRATTVLIAILNATVIWCICTFIIYLSIYK
jgi:hypothetical protein